MKPEHLANAQSIFVDTNIQVTARGQRHLGAALGSRSFAEEYVAQKVAAWTAEVSALAVVAATRPHAAYCAFTHGMIGRWIYVMRTIPNIGPLFQPLEDAIRLQFIPAFTGHGSCSMVEREVLSLPCRLGGLGIVNPTIVADLQYDASTKITNSLKDLIIQQSVTARLPDVSSIKNKIHMDRRLAYKERAKDVRSRLSSSSQRAIDLNSETGSSAWLTVLPLQDQGFHLNKQEFWDALHLRYGWKLVNTPSHCVCGSPFTPDHAMICRHGGLTFVRHNEIRDLTAEWLNKVCYDVATEPPLQQLSGEAIVPMTANRQDEARADIHARGFWGRRQGAFLT